VDRSLLLLLGFVVLVGCKPKPTNEEKYCAAALAIHLYAPERASETCVEEYRKLSPSQRTCTDACAVQGTTNLGPCLVDCGVIQAPIHHTPPSR
jgi:hypothetical protein